MPLETIEWKRNYGRASKNVVISPKFVRFEPEQVAASNGVKSMIGQPILHTFWIECSVSSTWQIWELYVISISRVFPRGDMCTPSDNLSISLNPGDFWNLNFQFPTKKLLDYVFRIQKEKRQTGLFSFQISIQVVNNLRLYH